MVGIITIFSGILKYPLTFCRQSPDYVLYLILSHFIRGGRDFFIKNVIHETFNLVIVVDL